MAEKKKPWDDWIRKSTDQGNKQNMAKPIDWKVAYPSAKSMYGKDAPILIRGARNESPIKEMREYEIAKEKLLKKTRKEAEKKGLPSKVSKGSAGRESAEKQRDRYARTMIRASK